MGSNTSRTALFCARQSNSTNEPHTSGLIRATVVQVTNVKMITDNVSCTAALVQIVVTVKRPTPFWKNVTVVLGMKLTLAQIVCVAMTCNEQGRSDGVQFCMPAAIRFTWIASDVRSRRVFGAHRYVGQHRCHVLCATNAQ